MDETLTIKDRRRVQRTAIDLPVILFSGTKRILCRAHQLSEFGILVTPPMQELIGEIVQIDLYMGLPKLVISLYGIVVYAIDNGIGIRFTGRPVDQHSLLKSYLKAREVCVVNHSSGMDLKSNSRAC